MLNETRAYVLELLGRSASLEVEPSQLDAFRYLDAGIISSFELMSFVMEIEEHFAIRFTPEQMQSEAFRTIGGLAALIEEAQ
jgi:acyl carrier protein